MIRIIAKLFAVTVVLAAFLHVAPVWAGADVTYISSTGNDDNPCTAAQPCATFIQGITAVGDGGLVSCLNAPNTQIPDELIDQPAFTIDCPGGVWSNANGITLTMVEQNAITLRHLTFNSAVTAISVVGSGTLILEDCNFQNNSGTALNINPDGALNLVITNSTISRSSSGILINPASGGSVKATFDRVTITQNSGGGIKIDSANGPVTVDITASVISDNSGNGLNAVSGAGRAAIFNIDHSVIADNGTAGIQANGASAAAMVDSTLLDSNSTGATAAVNGGRILTYGTNRIVGSAGSGFTAPAALQ